MSISISSKGPLQVRTSSACQHLGEPKRFDSQRWWVQVLTDPTSGNPELLICFRVNIRYCASQPEEFLDVYKTVELKAKPGKTNRLFSVTSERVLPILKKQQGFQGEIVLF